MLLFVVFFVRDPDVVSQPEPQNSGVSAEFFRTLSEFLKELYLSFLKSGPGPKLGLIVSLLPVGSFALAYALLGTIQVDYGLSTSQIAQISIFNTIAGGVGCIIGGWAGDRFGLKRTMGVFYLITVLPTLFLANKISAVGLEAIPIAQFYSAIVMHGLLFGMAFAVSKAIFMGMTNPVVAATQFTAFMAMSNLAISMANYWQGIVAERIGYATALYWDAFLVVFPLMIIPFLRNREEVPSLVESPA